LTTQGVIEAFDERRGDGVFRSNLGEALYFHCVTIADGTRTIDVGAKADGERAVGHLGRDEIMDVRALS
jgi:hypothetical protein